jgi:hypothetical protein
MYIELAVLDTLHANLEVVKRLNGDEWMIEI